jgi:hypothetical protein
MNKQEQFQEELKALLAKYDASIYRLDPYGVSRVQFYSSPEWYSPNTPVEGTGIDFICDYFDKDGE